MSSHEQMEAQARREWEERGMDPENFHLDKMIGKSGFALLFANSTA